MIFVRILALFLALAGSCMGAVIDFPTANRALLDGRPEDFYMYVDRDFEGVKSQPWEGGSFGFVRGPQRVAGDVIFATLHEGIDIKPVRRDAAGVPLDDILAAAPGRVVHVSAEAGASNYGKYVVLEHDLDGIRFLTLYAHLASVSVAPGTTVRQGDVLGRMGYTGRGLDRTRAHLHFEVALLLNRNFEQWYETFHGSSPNRHGLYNGMNLSGTDPAAILLAAAKNPRFNLADHVASLEPTFRITVKNSPNFSLIRDYPWLVPDGENANPPAWTVAFTRSGFPIRVVAAETPVEAPVLSWLQPSHVAPVHATRGIVGGSPTQPRLTDSGTRFSRLLTWPD